MVQNFMMYDEEQHRPTVIRLRPDLSNNKTTYTYSHLVISVTVVSFASFSENKQYAYIIHVII